MIIAEDPMSARRDKERRKDRLEKDTIRRYPSLQLVGTEGVPEKYLTEVKRAYRKVILNLANNKSNGRSEVLREFMKMIVKQRANSVSGMGMRNLMEWCSKADVSKCSKSVAEDMESFCQEGGSKKTRKFLMMLTHVRNELLSHMSEHVDFVKWMPDYCLSCGMLRDGWYIRFHAAEVQSTSGGKIYKHSRSVEVEGKTYEIWLSKHALDRIIGRVCKDPDVSVCVLAEFMRHGIFQFSGFGKFQHLLVCLMPTPYRRSAALSEEATAIDGHRGDEPVMRYLYFPFAVDGDKIILKSALLPGFYGTPEYAVKEDIASGRCRESAGGLSEQQWEEISKRAKQFYDRSNDEQMVMSDNFMTMSIIFHMLGHKQFYMADFELFPLIVMSPSEIGAA